MSSYNYNQLQKNKKNLDLDPSVSFVTSTSLAELFPLTFDKLKGTPGNLENK